MGKSSGLRGIDLSVFLPGSMMTVMMADEEAEVFKIENATGVLREHRYLSRQGNLYGFATSIAKRTVSCSI